MAEYFITGVGTDIGKTLLTTILCHQHTAWGYTVTALKPVISGYTPGNNDAARILQSLGHTPTDQAIDSIAPWRFTAPLSPDQAALQENRTLALGEIMAFCRRHEHKSHDLLLVEGAGGVMSPLTQQHTNLDLMIALGYSVLLVTGNYLGAISHTLTALFTLQAHNIPIAGIVINTTDFRYPVNTMEESIRRFTKDSISLYTLPWFEIPHEAGHTTPPLMDLCKK